MSLEVGIVEIQFSNTLKIVEIQKGFSQDKYNTSTLKGNKVLKVIKFVLFVGF